MEDTERKAETVFYLWGQHFPQRKSLARAGRVKSWVGSMTNFPTFLKMVLSLTDTHVPSTPERNHLEAQSLLLKSENANPLLIIITVVIKIIL